MALFSQTRTRAIFLVLLAALLAPVAARPADASHTCGSRSSNPKVYFVDTFSASCLGTNWSEGSTHGGWKVVFDGYGYVKRAYNALFVEPRAASQASATHAGLVVTTGEWDNFKMSVDVKTANQLRSPDPNTWETAWVLWRYTDADHFYYFILKTNGWELGKRDPAYPGGQRFLATGSTPSVSLSDWQTVKVRTYKGAMRVWVGDREIVSYSDHERPYLSGAVGLYTEDAEVRFDNVWVTRPW